MIEHQHQSRTKLLEAALAMFRAKGYAGASTFPETRA